MKLKPQTRQLTMAAKEVSDNVIELSYSSETPVSRSFGNEILSHEKDSVDLSRMNNKAPVLLNHDPNSQIGVVERSWIEAGKGKAEIRFSRNSRAQEVKQDVLDGIMPNTSVGYRIHDAEERANDDFVVTRWQPFELSIVSIPADATVGYGRNSDAEENEVNLKALEPEVAEIIEAEPEPEKEPEPEPEKEPELDDSERQQSIRSIATMYESDPEIAIRDGISVEEFQRQILENMTNKQEEKMPEETKKSFSLVRAINAQINNDWSKAEHEKEIVDGLRTADTKGMAIPAYAFREMQKATSEKGGVLVDDVLLTNEFIDILYNASWLGKVGARRMAGLVGDVTIQKKTKGSIITYGFLAESANVELKDFQMNELKLSPKVMGGGTACSRLLMMQSTPSIEMLIRTAIVDGASSALEKEALKGTGEKNSPHGLLTHIPATDSKASGKITRDDLVDAVSAIRTENVRGTLRVLMNAKQAGAFMKEKVGGTATAVPMFVLSSGRLDCGESLEVVVTEHMVDDRVLIGDFSELIVASWGAPDIVPDTATLAASGGLVVRLWQNLDIQIRYPEAFKVIKPKA